MATFSGYYRVSDQTDSHPVEGRVWVAHLILLTAVGYALFEERFAIGVATGGRGALQPMDPLVPLVGVLLLLGLGKIPGARLLRFDRRILPWAPYIALTIALPVLAVFINSDPVRTMYTGIHGFIAISFLVYGAWGAFAGNSVRKIAQRYMWVAVIAECLFALIDYLNKTGIYPSAIGQFLLKWNDASEGTMGEYSFLTWRCVGTFTNPNELGFWAVTVFWVSALLFRGFLRFTAVTAALLTLVLSESRGSLIALLCTSAVWLVYVAFTQDRRLSKARDATYLSALGFVLIAGWLSAGLAQSDGVAVSDKFSVITRFERGLNVLVEGAGADVNAEARVNAWQRALDFYYEHPLGTWSSPRMSFHLYIDSEYVRTLVQGSIVYLFALLLVLGASARRITKPGVVSRVIAMLAIGAAVNGMSAYPLEYPAIALLWILLGYDLAQEWRASRSAGPEGLLGYSPVELLADERA